MWDAKLWKNNVPVKKDRSRNRTGQIFEHLTNHRRNGRTFRGQTLQGLQYHVAFLFGRGLGINYDQAFIQNATEPTVALPWGAGFEDWLIPQLEPDVFRR
jgi:hypothetical protein